MQRLEVSGAVRPIYGSLGVKRLMSSFTIPRLEFSGNITDLFVVATTCTLKCLQFHFILHLSSYH
jgi:hypothetical protein